MTNETKFCHGCKRTLPRSMFRPKPDAKDGLMLSCRECLGAGAAWKGPTSLVGANIRDIDEGSLANSLAFVFRQIEEVALGTPGSATYRPSNR